MNDQLNFHLKHLNDDRAKAVKEREDADKRVRSITAQMHSALVEADTKRTQLTDGTTVYIVEPGPRRTIVPEKLLSLGVDPDIIRAATKESVVEPYVRVDAPKSELKDAAPQDAAPGQSPAADAETRH
jgi:hypothetical protein